MSEQMFVFTSCVSASSWSAGGDFLAALGDGQIIRATPFNVRFARIWASPAG